MELPRYMVRLEERIFKGKATGKPCKILIVPFCANRSFYKHHQIGKPYFWDNASDCPDETPAKEWSAREKAWRKAFGKEHTFAEAAFTFEIMSPDMIRFACFYGDGIYFANQEEINKARKERTKDVIEWLSQHNVSLEFIEEKLKEPLYKAMWADRK